MKKQTFTLSSRIAMILIAASATSQAFAYEQIVRPYQSVRTSGMGGVFETTGLYDQNFFGNPARVCANPTWRLTLLDISAEADTTAISNTGTISNVIKGSGNIVQDAASTAGSNNHARIQTVMPAWYLPPSMSHKWGLGIALITSTQADLGLRNNYSIDDQAYVDIGPAITFGRTFLEDDSLAVGITGHFVDRLNTTSPVSISNLLSGFSFSPTTSGGSGVMIDADVGVTKRLSHWHPWGLDVELAFALDNVANGNFSQGALFLKAPNQAQSMYRSYGGGISFHRESIGILRDPVLAVETSDIGTRNANGSFYRTLHMGAETRLISILLGRVGINQGYLTAGVGLDLRLLQIDFATYGEELGLNAGDMQDRRYAIRVGLQL